MTGLTLTLKNPAKDPLRQRIDLSALFKAGVFGMDLEKIKAKKLFLGNQKCRLDDLFKVSGKPGDKINIRNSCSLLDGLGAGMSEGTLTIDGDAGAYLGESMTGGTIEVQGNTGDFAACAMNAGQVVINGNAGDFLGGALAGERLGMRGGMVRVAGDAGERAGDQMRRGFLLIEGNVGSYCASRMVAGTIAVLGKIGPNLGVSMKRGTVFTRHSPLKSLSATFNDCGSHKLPFFHLFLTHLQKKGGKFAKLPSRDRLRCYAGDLAVDGKGEILFYDH